MSSIIESYERVQSRVKPPEGYTMRPARREDLQEVVQMLNEACRHLNGADKFSMTRLGREWDMHGFNLESDSQVALDPAGNIVAYYDVFDLYEPHVQIYCYGHVHPSQACNGLDLAMLNWAEQRARLSIRLAPESAQVILLSNLLALDLAGQERFQNAGFSWIRGSLRMMIDLNQDLPFPVWPKGISMRKFEMEQDDEAVVHALRECFSDHWGYVERPFESELANFRHRWANDPDFDPDLYFLAIAGEEIAGISLCYKQIEEDPEMGWVGSLGVRRGWRRNGIGLALLLHSFQELKRKGKARAGLGVDAENLTGATRLYEKAGMRPVPESSWKLYSKVLRPGIDLCRQSLEE